MHKPDPITHTEDAAIINTHILGAKVGATSRLRLRGVAEQPEGAIITGPSKDLRDKV